MADGDEKHHYCRLFHHHTEDDEEEPKDLEKELKHHKHVGRVSKLTAFAAGAYALHENHKAKKDPGHSHHHKKAEAIAATVALGAAGLALHKHHEKKDVEKKIKEQQLYGY